MQAFNPQLITEGQQSLTRAVMRHHREETMAQINDPSLNYEEQRRPRARR